MTLLGKKYHLFRGEGIIVGKAEVIEEKDDVVTLKIVEHSIQPERIGETFVESKRRIKLLKEVV